MSSCPTISYFIFTLTEGVRCRRLTMALVDDEEDVNQIIADELRAYEAKLAEVQEYPFCLIAMPSLEVADFILTT